MEIIIIKNRIIHSYRSTSKDKDQVLATKNPDNQVQYEIKEEHLINFIKLNDKLSDILNDLRRF